MALFKCMCIFLVSLLLALTFTNAQEESSHRTLPPFPCIPGQPRPPRLPPCPPAPTECYTSLSGMMPCADFLTHNEVPPMPPTVACCDGLRSLVTNASICLCHIVNGNINKLLPAPMIPVRMVALPRFCVVRFPRAILLPVYQRAFATDEPSASTRGITVGTTIYIASSITIGITTSSIATRIAVDTTTRVRRLHRRHQQQHHRNHRLIHHQLRHQNHHLIHRRHQQLHQRRLHPHHLNHERYFKSSSSLVKLDMRFRILVDMRPLFCSHRMQ
uniref:Bifunctional inhibitor/plant lipid transfer protein/seed storage helical domain-containing protein n=1 Tax=Zea mays TaxID=4577 RepID=B6T491_MAIZE|nr:hypothetical protein [Zea mays]|eukprot:NP_001143421.1 uncharacterized LOC100276068 precursor [Zea mays]